MRKPATNTFGSMADEDYASSFEQYISDAIAVLLKHFQDADVHKQVEAPLHPIMDSITAKFKLVSLDCTSITFGLPVLTHSPLLLLALHLNRIPLAIKEVHLLSQKFSSFPRLNQIAAADIALV